MSHFFAYLSRMKFIRRWGLMHNTYPENVQEHSLRVAMVAHALAVIRNRLFAGNVSGERTALLALYHDAGEVLTGDLPAPVKYFNPEIKNAYKEIEAAAASRLLKMIPEGLQSRLSGALFRWRSGSGVSRTRQGSGQTLCLPQVLGRDRRGKSGIRES